MIDKQKWENYWYYYKVHTWVGLIVLVVLAFTIKDCASRVESDIDVIYIGSHYLLEEEVDNFKQLIAPSVSDVNNDEKIEIGFQSITLSGREITSEQDFAMAQKVDLVFAAGEVHFLVVDKTQLEVLTKRGYLKPLNDFVADNNLDFSEYPEVTVLDEQTQQSYIYGIPVDKNKLFNSGSFPDLVYLCITSPRQNDLKNNKTMSKFQNADNVLQSLVD